MTDLRLDALRSDPQKWQRLFTPQKLTSEERWLRRQRAKGKIRVKPGERPEDPADDETGKPLSPTAGSEFSQLTIGCRSRGGVSAGEDGAGRGAGAEAEAEAGGGAATSAAVELLTALDFATSMPAVAQLLGWAGDTAAGSSSLNPLLLPPAARQPELAAAAVAAAGPAIALLAGSAAAKANKGRSPKKAKAGARAPVAAPHRPAPRARRLSMGLSDEAARSAEQDLLALLPHAQLHALRCGHTPSPSYSHSHSHSISTSTSTSTSTLPAPSPSKPSVDTSFTNCVFAIDAVAAEAVAQADLSASQRLRRLGASEHEIVADSESRHTARCGAAARALASREAQVSREMAITAAASAAAAARAATTRRVLTARRVASLRRTIELRLLRAVLYAVRAEVLPSRRAARALQHWRRAALYWRQEHALCTALASRRRRLRAQGWSLLLAHCQRLRATETLGAALARWNAREVWFVFVGKSLKRPSPGERARAAKWTEVWRAQEGAGDARSEAQVAAASAAAAAAAAAATAAAAARDAARHRLGGRCSALLGALDDALGRRRALLREVRARQAALALLRKDLGVANASPSGNGKPNPLQAEEVALRLLERQLAEAEGELRQREHDAGEYVRERAARRAARGAAQAAVAAERAIAAPAAEEVAQAASPSRESMEARESIATAEITAAAAATPLAAPTAAGASHTAAGAAAVTERVASAGAGADADVGANADANVGADTDADTSPRSALSRPYSYKFDWTPSKGHAYLAAAAATAAAQSAVLAASVAEEAAERVRRTRAANVCERLALRLLPPATRAATAAGRLLRWSVRHVEIRVPPGSVSLDLAHSSDAAWSAALAAHAGVCPMPGRILLHGVRPSPSSEANMRRETGAAALQRAQWRALEDVLLSEQLPLDGSAAVFLLAVNGENVRDWPCAGVEARIQSCASSSRLLTLGVPSCAPEGSWLGRTGAGRVLGSLVAQPGARSGSVLRLAPAAALPAGVALVPPAELRWCVRAFSVVAYGSELSAFVTPVGRARGHVAQPRATANPPATRKGGLGWAGSRVHNSAIVQRAQLSLPQGRRGSDARGARGGGEDGAASNPLLAALLDEAAQPPPPPPLSMVLSTSPHQFLSGVSGQELLLPLDDVLDARSANGSSGSEPCLSVDFARANAWAWRRALGAYADVVPMPSRTHVASARPIAPGLITEFSERELELPSPVFLLGVDGRDVRDMDVEEVLALCRSTSAPTRVLELGVVSASPGAAAALDPVEREAAQAAVGKAAAQAVAKAAAAVDGGGGAGEERAPAAARTPVPIDEALVGKYLPSGRAVTAPAAGPREARRSLPQLPGMVGAGLAPPVEEIALRAAAVEGRSGSLPGNGSVAAALAAAKWRRRRSRAPSLDVTGSSQEDVARYTYRRALRRKERKLKRKSYQVTAQTLEHSRDTTVGLDRYRELQKELQGVADGRGEEQQPRRALPPGNSPAAKTLARQLSRAALMSFGENDELAPGAQPPALTPAHRLRAQLQRQRAKRRRRLSSTVVASPTALASQLRYTVVRKEVRAPVGPLLAQFKELTAGAWARATAAAGAPPAALPLPSRTQLAGLRKRPGGLPNLLAAQVDPAVPHFLLAVDGEDVSRLSLDAALRVLSDRAGVAQRVLTFGVLHGRLRADATPGRRPSTR
eukprot:g4594.t1